MQATLSGADWLREPAVAAVFGALDGDGAETRFVGGAVRDGLLGRPVSDIDFATSLTPDETSRRLVAAGLKAAPTGLAHGTVTAVVDGRGFEVTTLRQDVETDGRHAVVAFTDDWRGDAARRDFTINAMSADRSGVVYDYFAGLDDLKAGRVRFVGVAEDRVREDYLRILRFFRFHAWYGQGEIDSAGLAAARVGADGLAKVSAERVRVELLRLLAAPDPTATVDAMSAMGVLQILIGDPCCPLQNLIAVEQSAGLAPDPILRLAALAPATGDLTTRLRLSRAEARALAALSAPWDDLGADALAWRRALYRIGPAAFRGRAILAAAEGETGCLAGRLAAANAWSPQRLPVNGKDLLRAGLTHGPEVGAMLQALEEHWIEQDFVPDRAALIDEAKARIVREGSP